MAFLRRWVAKVMLKVRSSVRITKQVKAQFLFKKDRHAYLDNTSCISQHDDLLREMCAAEKAAAEDAAALYSAFLSDFAVPKDSALIDPALLDCAFLPDSAVLEDPAVTCRHRTSRQRPPKRAASRQLHTAFSGR
ncbi:hypothetical protein E4U15_000053 [Claviceps sp. LM218 group G6]|nr:hypothetical protein E4U15_000053 [Claviceps sp. LM218 group G6]